MKKQEYLKPTMRVIVLQHKFNILTGSPDGEVHGIYRNKTVSNDEDVY